MEDQQLIELYQGDGVVVYFPFADVQGMPYDMTGHDAHFIIYSNSKKEVVLSRSMSLDEAVNNIMKVRVDPLDTAELSGNYTYYIKVLKSQQFKRIVAKGPLKIHVNPEI